MNKLLSSANRSRPGAQGGHAIEEPLPPYRAARGHKDSGFFKKLKDKAPAIGKNEERDAAKRQQEEVRCPRAPSSCDARIAERARSSAASAMRRTRRWCAR
jgi:hypothetical protein